jgi:hypothetical protein
VIKFVSDLPHVSSTNKTDRHDMTEVLMKMLLMYFAILMELIVGVLMPLYTHLNILMADSFIGGNRLPRENHHVWFM